MTKHLKIAILDMNNGKPNQGMRGIKNLVKDFLNQSEYDGHFDLFDVRQKNEVPKVEDYDIFVSSGGPGSPYPAGDAWEERFNHFLDNLLAYNAIAKQKKFAFLICHSFQLACYHWGLGNVCPRRSTSFGILPVHKTQEGMKESFFDGLPNPFYVVDSRDFQVIEPNDDKIEALGGALVALEKIRPHVKLERAMMALRFTPEIFGTQFHPEADADGMRFHFSLPEKKNNIIKHFGEDKYDSLLNHLEDDDKIMLTEKTIIPTFLKTSAKKIFSIHENAML